MIWLAFFGEFVLAGAYLKFALWLCARAEG